MSRDRDVDSVMLLKDRCSQFVAALQDERRVIAPAERNGELRFAPIEDADEVRLDYRNTTRSPKGVFFPQTEAMMRFGRQRSDLNAIRAVPMDETPTVLLGVRPCDARSFLLLDAIFAAGPYLDPYYRSRRENTLIISLACDRPRSTCFCHAFESGPDDTEGSDILMRPAGDAYILEPVTERGQELLNELELPPADDAHLDQAAEIVEAARERLQPIESVAGIEEMLPDLFEADDLWQRVSAKCLACGTCTYNCPTCHCFNIEDRLLAANGERVRTWDSCMFPTFTVHASGHNPRPDQAARWRQRTMHKFEYLPRNVDRYGCVGCGRCIQSCPVRLDIRRVLEAVREYEPATPEPAETE